MNKQTNSPTTKAINVVGLLYWKVLLMKKVICIKQRQNIY